jgi:septum formation protein
MGATGDVVVLAADTTVDVDGEVLAKPENDDDARRMLRLLSGRTHQVHTAVVAWRVSGMQTVTTTTDVTFVDLDEATIDWYVATGEHRDKAGAYGIQGAAGALVERVDGSPTNVIGLPLAETAAMLQRCGVRSQEGERIGEPDHRLSAWAAAESRGAEHSGATYPLTPQAPGR